MRGRPHWFCPITDSMRINSFLKVNQLIGKSHDTRLAIPPQVWRFKPRYLSTSTPTKYARIVLLEDFVGSGTQMESAVKHAAAISADIRVLACPLVTCPEGLQRWCEFGADLRKRVL